MPQDPDVIQRQIEQTRAELSETIDAITQIVSPKRVAERANEQLRLKVTELRQRILPDGSAAPALLGGGTGRHAVATARRGAAAGPGSAPGGGEGGPAGPEGVVVTEAVRTVRWDRVALVSAVCLLMLGNRRRRRRRR